MIVGNINTVVKRAILRMKVSMFYLPTMNLYREMAGLEHLSVDEFIDEVCETSESIRSIMKGGSDGD